jgi:hypothetical protein
MQKFAIPQYFFDNMDTIAAVLGIFLGIVIVCLYLISKTVYLLTFGFALAIVCLIYILIKNKKDFINTPVTAPTRNILEIAFFALYSLSLLILQYSNGRPLLYFVLITLCAGLLTLSIWQVKSKFDVFLQIIKIFMLSFNLKYSIVMFYAGSGIDYWVHLFMNNQLANTGFTTVLVNKEIAFPLMHIQVALHEIVMNIAVKDATNTAIIIPFIIASVCIFFVANKFFGVKIGLLAMLIVNMTDFALYWGSAPQTTTFGVCLYYFIIFIIFQTVLQKRTQALWLIILFVFLLAMILGHAVSSFILLVSIAGLMAGSCLYKIFYDNDANIFPSITIIFFYGILLEYIWYNALFSKKSDEGFFGFLVNTLDNSLSTQASFLNRPETITEYVIKLPPLIEQVLNVTGITLLIALGAIGCLFWLTKKYRNVYTFSMLTCTVSLMTITFVFPLFGIRNIMPNRWFAFFYFFLSIMAAFAIFYLLAKVPRPGVKSAMLVVIISCLTFFMITSTVSNLDSPLWLTQDTISTSYTWQEIQGAETLTRYSGNVFSDQRYGDSILGDLYNTQNSPLLSDDLSKHVGKIFIWREYMENGPILQYLYIKGYYKYIDIPTVLGPEFHNKLEMMQKVYTDNGISGYEIRDLGE